jgi:hypothetical protein
MQGTEHLIQDLDRQRRRPRAPTGKRIEPTSTKPSLSRTDERNKVSASVDTKAKIVAQDQASVRYSLGDPIYDYFGKTSPHHFGPEACLGDLGPNRSTRNHFHPVDSFQLFWGAAGSEFEGRLIPKNLLHYSDAYGVYGGFSTTEERIQCFTLRPTPSAFTAYMDDPERRSFVPNRRNYDSDIEPLLAQKPPAGADVVTHTLMAPEGDGLAAYFIEVGPEGEIPAELVSSPNTSGSYVCVLEGELEWDGDLYGPRSLAWLPPTGDNPTMRPHRESGPLRLVAMFFPSPLTSERRPFES